MSHASRRWLSGYLACVNESPTRLHAVPRREVASDSTPPLLEFRELRYFVVLCEELHFSRAADRLHISQSPLSQAIAQLERKLGTKLLDRSSRHVQLTDAGSVLLEHGRRLLREAEEAVGATRRAGAGEGGSIRLRSEEHTSEPQSRREVVCRR